MGQFVFFAILLALLAVAFAISALWQRSRALALVLALAVPLAAGGLYWFKGAPLALDPANTRQPETIEEATAQLERIVQAEPFNYEKLAELARLYRTGQKWDKARDTYERTLKLHVDPTMSVEYAETLMRTSPDRRFPPEAVAILENALKADPQNQYALFFLGLHQRQSGEPAKAATTWTQLLALVDPAMTAELRRQIDAARQDAGLQAAPAAAPLLEVQVDLDAKLAQQLGTSTVLYVIAKRPDQPGPPVAVKRLEVDHYPLPVQLSDADSVMPTQRLSAQANVVLQARISRSGDARPASGDLESMPITVQMGPGAKATLAINRTVP